MHDACSEPSLWAVPSPKCLGHSNDEACKILLLLASSILSHDLPGQSSNGISAWRPLGNQPVGFNSHLQAWQRKSPSSHTWILIENIPFILETLLLFENDAALFQNPSWRVALQCLHLTNDSFKLSEKNKRTELPSCRQLPQMPSRC